jgi:hypothetical protein
MVESVRARRLEMLQIVDELAEAAGNSEPQAQGWAVQSLQELHRAAGMALVGLAGHPETEFRRAAMQALRDVPRWDLFDLAFRALDEPYDEVKVPAFMAIVEAGNEAELRRLLSLETQIGSDPIFADWFSQAVALLEARVAYLKAIGLGRS